MSLKHLAVTALTIIGVIAVANRTNVGRSILGGSATPWF